MRVLDLGCGHGKAAPELWPEAEIVRVDADPEVEPDVVADVRTLPVDLGEFDVILASHILEHLRREEVLPVLRTWGDRLVGGGELHILVPDLAWAAEKILSGQMSCAVMAQIYGSQANEWQHHRVGFTVGLLRSAVRGAGLVVRAARVGPYGIRVSGADGVENEVEARQIYVVGVKPEIVD